MRICLTCGEPYKMNYMRMETCKECRQKEKDVDALCREEERLEKKMGPPPEYVR